MYILNENLDQAAWVIQSKIETVLTILKCREDGIVLYTDAVIILENISQKQVSKLYEYAFCLMYSDSDKTATEYKNRINDLLGSLSSEIKIGFKHHVNAPIEHVNKIKTDDLKIN